MARVVVVGGGLGGMASAARLAKQGHEVVVASPDLGGALVPFEADGFSWDLQSVTLLPAVVRDLARKSGRPLERELDLEPVDIVREHRWRDGTVHQVPGGSRAAQLESLGRAWVDHVAPYGETWELTRHHLFETRSSILPHDLVKLLRRRETFQRRLRRDFRDKKLREVAATPFLLAGHLPRDMPAWAGQSAYLEQRFGAWRPVGGMAALRDVLVRRLETRKVVHVAEPVLDLVLRGDRAVAVRTAAGEIDADRVVVAIDPRGLPALAPWTTATLPAMPATVVHLGLTGDVPELPHDVVLHGDPMMIVRPAGRGPDGTTAWTVLVRGQLLEDIDLALWRHKIKLRPEQVLSQHRRSPATLVAQWHGSPNGVAWRGRSTVQHRIGPHTPFPNVYAAGAASISGDGLPFVGLSAALVAAAIGPA